MSIFFAVIALGVLITVHEFGHFITAKLSGVYVEKFSIGFGPCIFKYNFNGTEYMLSAIPLGGYVKLHRMFAEEEALADREGEAFYNKSVYKKIFIITGGVLANVIFAFLMFVSIYAVGYKTYAPVVGSVVVGSTAADAGFLSQDIIKEVDGKPISTWIDFSAMVSSKEKRSFLVEIERQGARLILNYEPSEIEIDGEESIDLGMSVYISPIVGNVTDNYPAAIAGMKSGDVITAINANPVDSWEDIRLLIQDAKDRVDISVLRNGKSIFLEMYPVLIEEGANYRKIIGVSPSEGDVVVRMGILRSFKDAAEQTTQIIGLMYKGLGMMISGKASRGDIGGPIMIVQETSRSFEMGFENYIFFVALISLNLAVLNILPLPILDGGYVVMYLYEAISKKRVSVKFREISQRIGIALLGGLMIFAIFNDILRFFKK